MGGGDGTGYACSFIEFMHVYSFICICHIHKHEICMHRMKEGRGLGLKVPNHEALEEEHEPLWEAVREFNKEELPL